MAGDISFVAFTEPLLTYKFSCGKGLKSINRMKKTVVLGASPKAYRYSYTATQRLSAKGHEVIPIGISEGDIAGIAIQKGQPDLADVDTITLYLRPERQKEYYEYILSLMPNRIIFNPGTENPELVSLAQAQGIEVEIACTLVMLSVGSY